MKNKETATGVETKNRTKSATQGIVKQINKVFILYV